MKVSTEFDPSANIVPGDDGDILPPDVGIFDGTGRWPRIDKRLAYEEENFRTDQENARIEELMAEETERLAALATEQAEDAKWDTQADKQGSYYLGGNESQRREIDETARRILGATASSVSAHVADRTDRDVPQPLKDPKQIATNTKWIRHFRENGFRQPQ